MGFKFEKLIVWQKAVDLAADVHELTKSFPKDELFILSAQMKRGADSVSLILPKVRPASQMMNSINFYLMRCDQILKVLAVCISAEKKDHQRG